MNSMNYQAWAIVNGNEISRPERETQREARNDADMLRERYPVGRVVVLDLNSPYAQTVVYEVPSDEDEPAVRIEKAHTYTGWRIVNAQTGRLVVGGFGTKKQATAEARKSGYEVVR